MYIYIYIYLIPTLDDLGRFGEVSIEVSCPILLILVRAQGLNWRTIRPSCLISLRFVELYTPPVEECQNFAY